MVRILFDLLLLVGTLLLVLVVLIVAIVRWKHKRNRKGIRTFFLIIVGVIALLLVLCVIAYAIGPRSSQPRWKKWKASYRIEGAPGALLRLGSQHNCTLIVSGDTLIGDWSIPVNDEEKVLLHIGGVWAKISGEPQRPHIQGLPASHFAHRDYDLVRLNSGAP